MKSLPPLALTLLGLSFGAAAAQAQCCGPYGTYTGLELIDRPHPQENLFPDGGWTLYPGQAGSGVPTLSPYSHINILVPPAVVAAGVNAKLQQLGIPIKPPEPQFLGRNPAIAEGAQLPTPKAWLPKDEEKDKNNRNDLPPGSPDNKDNAKPKNKEAINKPAVETIDAIPKKLPAIKPPPTKR